MAIVYGIRCLINNKIYVGSTKQKDNARWKTHRRDLRKRSHYNDHLQRAWNKYGEDNFEHIILEEVKDNDDQFDREQHWMDFYEAYNEDKGYNATRTAGRVEMTEEVKRKISEKMKGRPLTPEHIEAFSKAKIGEKRSEEVKKKLSELAKGRIHSEDTKDKISKGGKGLKRSDETKQRIAEARRGKKFPRNKD